MYIDGEARTPDQVPFPSSGRIMVFADSTNFGVLSQKLDDGSIIPLGVSTVDPGDYLGTRNPNTNTPIITSGVGTQDQFYITSEDALADVGIDNIGTPKAGSSIYFDAGFWNSGTAPSGTVQSVNGQIGIVTLDTDQIPDTTINKYTTQADIDRLANTSGTNTGDQDLTNYFDKTIDDTDDITETVNKVFVSPTEKTAITHTNRSDLDLVSGINTGDQDLTDYLNKTTDTYLQDIVGGTGITINKTDPKNPIINSTSTGGGGTLFLRSQFRYSTLNIITSDLLAEDLNRTQMFYTGGNANITKVKVRCYDIGTNSNTATMNLTVNGLAVLTANLILATGLVESTLLQNTALVDGDEIKREVVSATGDSDVLDGYVEVEIG